MQGLTGTLVERLPLSEKAMASRQVADRMTFDAGEASENYRLSALRVGDPAPGGAPGA